MFGMRSFATGSEKAIIMESLPPLDSLVRPSFISKDEKIASEMKGGRSAFLRAVAHIVDEDYRATESDLQKAHTHFNNVADLLGQNAESVDLAFVYGFRGFIGAMLNIISRDQVPLSNVADDLEKSGELVPHWSIYYTLGMVYRQQNASGKALQSLEKAIDLKMDYAKAFLLKGIIHQERGETSEAHEDIFLAISLNPDLYEEKFEPIMESERKSQEKWDELYSQPDTKEALRAWADEANENDLTGKTSISPSGHK